jgi:hypothetical protein
MVAPPSFESPTLNLAATLRAGTVQDPAARQAGLRRLETSPAEPRQISTSPASTAATAPVRGDRPVSPTLSAPFVAQFIAQEVNPPAARPRNQAETARAFDAFRQALANAERARGPAR